MIIISWAEERVQDVCNEILILLAACQQFTNKNCLSIADEYEIENCNNMLLSLVKQIEKSVLQKIRK